LAIVGKRQIERERAGDKEGGRESVWERDTVCEGVERKRERLRAREKQGGGGERQREREREREHER